MFFIAWDNGESLLDPPRDKHVVPPTSLLSMRIAISLPSSRAVNASPGNLLPWAVLKNSGFP